MKIYKIICLIYSYIFFVYEEIFFKCRSNNKDISNLGFHFIKSKKNNLKQAKAKAIIKVNDYHFRYIYDENQINKFLIDFLDFEFKRKITELTGYKYSIDYFTSYKNCYINPIVRVNGYYANHFHIDKPYSRNMLKIFIPMDNIDENSGPLEIINKVNTQNILKRKIAISSSPKILFTSKKENRILLMQPNICLHKAGIPFKRKYTKLIMLQLNPSCKWEISKDLYKKQYKSETKFTNLANFFTKKIRL